MSADASEEFKQKLFTDFNDNIFNKVGKPLDIMEIERQLMNSHPEIERIRYDNDKKEFTVWLKPLIHNVKIEGKVVL